MATAHFCSLMCSSINRKQNAIEREVLGSAWLVSSLVGKIP